MEQTRIAVYNSSDTSPSWSFVDGNTAHGINNDSTKSADSPQLTVFNEKLYASWSEYNGVSWQVRVALGRSLDLPTRSSQYNFPNPFNLKTKTVSLRTGTGANIGTSIRGTYIVVAPTGSGSVTIKIKIFNLTGDLVREITESGTAAQYNYIHWDGKNLDGSDVASGVYFAVVDVPGSNKKKPIKMVVVK